MNLSCFPHTQSRVSFIFQSISTPFHLGPCLMNVDIVSTLHPRHFTVSLPRMESGSSHPSLKFIAWRLHRYNRPYTCHWTHVHFDICPFARSRFAQASKSQQTQQLDVPGVPNRTLENCLICIRVCLFCLPPIKQTKGNPPIEYVIVTT